MELTELEKKMLVVALDWLAAAVFKGKELGYSEADVEALRKKVSESIEH